MKITEMIKKLEELKEKHGDVPCFVSMKNQMGDRIFDKSINEIHFESSIIDPKCICICTDGIAFYMHGVY
jgi:hypothetical protein